MSEEQPAKCVTSFYQNNGESPTVMVGIPADVYERMRQGKAFHFDFTQAGVAVKVVIYGGETIKDVENTLINNAKQRGTFLVDDRLRDPRVKPS